MTIVVVVVAMRKVCNNSVKIYFIMSLSAIWDPMQPVCPQMLLFSNPGVYEINDLLLFFGGGGVGANRVYCGGFKKTRKREVINPG